MSKGKRKIPPYLCGNEEPENFAMIPPELIRNERFLQLKPAAALFYLKLCIYVHTPEQKQTLYCTLKEYNERLGLGWNDEDIKYKTWGNKRTGKQPTLFVCPESHMKEYNYTSQYTNKLRRELVKAGFIKPVFGGKGRNTAFSKNVTVWEFTFST